MATVEIPDNYLEVLNDFGEIHDLIRTAVKSYAVELATGKMEEYKNAIEAMESKYGCDYKRFITLSVNQDFREKVLKRNSEWKDDLRAWEKCTQDFSIWVERITQLIQAI